MDERKYARPLDPNAAPGAREVPTETPTGVHRDAEPPREGGHVSSPVVGFYERALRRVREATAITHRRVWGGMGDDY